MEMNTQAIESLFGPASEKIDVNEFIESARQDALPGQISDTILDECSVSDIRDSLYSLWNNPTLSATLIKDHEHTIATLHASVNPRKPRKSYLPNIDSLLPEVSNLQQSIDSVSLTAWRLHAEAVTFMRTPRNSDHNILEEVRATPALCTVIETPQAVLTISVHNRVSWGPSYVNRSSQHAFLSSQSLQDLCRAIPCISNNLPTEAGLESDNVAEEAQFVMYIEGFLYGDENGNKGYADKLINQIEVLKKKPIFSITKAPTSLKQTKFSSLSVRLNEPYWLIHKGNCEHFIVVDQIRLLHPSDPQVGYPLTLQIIPSLIDLCRACSRVPAVWSIVGDVRLGENPCVLCDPCWKHMGESKEEGVVALPLPNPALAII